MSTSTPKTKQIVEECGMLEYSTEAAFMRSLEKENNQLRGRMDAMKRDMAKVRDELEPAARNRHLMQVARPARTCLNIIRPYL